MQLFALLCFNHSYDLAQLRFSLCIVWRTTVF